MSVPNDPAQNPQPDVDVTVGRNPVVGDAPPSDGTGADVSVNPPTQTAGAAEELDLRPVIESSTVQLLESRRFHRAASDRLVDPTAFHTASARAAAFPGLQPEIETSAHPMPLHGGWAMTSDLPTQ
jgi:hypothetical protein